MHETGLSTGHPAAGTYKVPAYGLFGEEIDATGYSFFHVEPLNVRNVPNGWHIDTHLHPHMDQISVVLSGDSEFELNGVWHGARSSSIVYMPANVVHTFHYEPDAKGFIISCSRDFLNAMTQESPMLAEARQQLRACCGTPIDADPHRVEQVCSTLSDYTRHSASRAGLEARYLFYHLWLLLRRSTGCGSPGNSEPRNNSTEFLLFDRFRRSLEESFHYSNAAGDAGFVIRKTAEYYATKLDVSVFQLNRCIRHVAGKSANELIKETLLAEATRLLLYTAIPVKEISSFLGYSNSSHFIRFFKLERGLAPDAFRNANTIFAQSHA
jgi:AraC family transcriptional activator of pobA